MSDVKICYATLSGNTEEIAESIKEELNKSGVSASLYDINGASPPPKITKEDTMFIGSYTWDYGRVPIEVKDFVADINCKPNKTFVFGSGDTQFGGDELFCKATDKLATFYKSPFQPLKIEQSPRGSQEKM